MIIREIRSDIEAIVKNGALYEKANFRDRVKAIDYIEFNVIERIEGMTSNKNRSEELVTLKQQAEAIKNQLEEINHHLFRQLRADIRAGTCTGAELARRIKRYVGYSWKDSPQNDIGYDSLDVFTNGLLLIDGIPGETRKREPEMVYYQPTPARITWELSMAVADLEQEGGVFYDLGSGLGQVPILVNLLSGTQAKGIEFEPAYCEYAKRCAAELDLSRVEFINCDAREADYSDGAVFYMYTPFKGRLLHQVLERLKEESQRRTIRLYTYGTCTRDISEETWLEHMDHNGNHEYKLGVFRSL